MRIFDMTWWVWFVLMLACIFTKFTCWISRHLAALCCEINIGSFRDLYDAFVPLVYLSSMCKNMRACEQYNREDIRGVKKSWWMSSAPPTALGREVFLWGQRLKTNRQINLSAAPRVIRMSCNNFWYVRQWRVSSLYSEACLVCWGKLFADAIYFFGL